MIVDADTVSNLKAIVFHAQNIALTATAVVGTWRLKRFAFFAVLPCRILVRLFRELILNFLLNLDPICFTQIVDSLL